MVAYRSGGDQPITKDVIYTDLDIRLIAHPVTNKLVVLKNNDAVKRALKNLIFTNHFERPYKPLFGGNIRALLFENYDPSMVEIVSNQIKTAIQNYEPRVQVQSVKVDPSKIDNNELHVTIVFGVRNQPKPTQLSFSVERIR